MIDSLQAEKCKYLNAWFHQPQGREIAAAFAMELKSFRSRLQGGHLIHLGLGGAHPWLTGLHYRSKWFLNSFLSDQSMNLCTDLQRLPLERNSVDCVLAPLIVEALPEANSLIEEIDRVLKPMGYVIFLGINPFSLWGLALKTGYLHCFGDHKGTLLSSFTLKHHLLNRGFRQCVLNSFYYIPPIQNPHIIKALAFLNPMGRMIWPFPAGFYCLIMQKFETLPPTFDVNLFEKNFLTSFT